MAGIVTTLFASVLAFAAGGLLATPFTTFDGDSTNQGLAAVNGLVFVGVAFYVQLEPLFLIGSLFAGVLVVGAITEFLRQ
ncbi:hypothetical protein G9C85_12630 [Halorubellus sp. JP-L1]|uniref:hypothetical protein n=1 Tax=Halorubellus sp. JP-L1 TaxID=2715753 RepID=UPI0014088FC7|nr:hypothetical protein [Halorubellus sp. JP-L1]NHN42464.1 hypothetical protein [Halorubellus sp. JP-L1]